MKQIKKLIDLMNQRNELLESLKANQATMSDYHLIKIIEVDDAIQTFKA